MATHTLVSMASKHIFSNKPELNNKLLQELYVMSIKEPAHQIMFQNIFNVHTNILTVASTPFTIVLAN